MLPDWKLEATFERVAGHGLAALELRVRDNPPGNPAPSYWGRHLADDRETALEAYRNG